MLQLTRTDITSLYSYLMNELEFTVSSQTSCLLNRYSVFKILECLKANLSYAYEIFQIRRKRPSISFLQRYKRSRMIGGCFGGNSGAGGIHNMLKVRVCAAHMGGFLGPKFSKGAVIFNPGYRSGGCLAGV